jgi:Asp-tRNA(Asn)/Glu-tRNA(Gln) amidotransferase A subunit family amidase
MRATVPFNLSGLPGLSLPFSFSKDGLPINVQLVSQWFDEARILYLGQLIESATGTHLRHPNL